MSQTLYDILGVDAGATQERITLAYRYLARRYHPDHNDDPQAPERFKQVARAYEILGDPEKRKRYDETGSTEDFSQFVDPLLAQVLEAQIAYIITQRADPQIVNVLGGMQTLLKSMEAELKKAIEEDKRQIETLENIAGRFTGGTLLAEMALAPVREIVEHREQKRVKLQIIGLALDKLKVYGYNFQRPKSPQYRQQTNTSGATEFAKFFSQLDQNG